MSSFEYDSVGFDPPAPMIDVEISASGSRGEQTVIRMLLDSGTDMPSEESRRIVEEPPVRVDRSPWLH